MTFRLLPVLIVAAALTLSVKIGGLWHGLGAMIEAGTPAAHATEAKPAGQDSPGLAMAPAAAEPHGAAEPDGGAAEFTPWRIDPPDQGDPEARPTAPLHDPYDLTDQEIDLLQRLSARREEIERRATDLGQREALLTAAEQRIDQKVAELEALRRSIEDLVVQHDDQEESQIRSLVKIYENMKPKDAARIFEELDMIVLLEVIDRMKERKAAPVLAQMTPSRAKAITLELAQRRNLPIDKQ